MDEFNKLYEDKISESDGIFKGMDAKIDKIYARAKGYKPAKVKVGKDTYVLVFDSKQGLFVVYDESGNDIGSDLGIGAGFNTRKLCRAITLVANRECPPKLKKLS